MKTYLHGTSYESAMNMINNGIQDEPDRIWECSNTNYMYFRDADDEEAEYLCIENGQIAAAYNDSKESYIALLVLEMSDELADEIVENDDSCENMYDCYQVEIKDIKRFIASGDITAKIRMYADSYVPYLRPFYLSNIDKYLEISDSLLLDAIKVIRRSDIYMDELFDYGSVDDEFTLKTGGIK